METDAAAAVDATMAPLLGADAESRIPDQYIVVFEDSVGTAGMRAAMSRITLHSAWSRIENQYSIIPRFLGPADRRGSRGHSTPSRRRLRRGGSDHAGGQNLILCSDFDDTDGNACACGSASPTRG